MTNMIDAGSVVDAQEEGFALRVLGTQPTETLINIAETLFSGIYPCRTMHRIVQGTGGEIYAVLEEDSTMKKLDHKRIMVKHGTQHFKIGLVRVPRGEIRARSGPCLFRRLN
jgi:hypothetical protein